MTDRPAPEAAPEAASELPFELREAEYGDARRTRSKRLRNALIAAGLIGALGLGGCSMLFGLWGQSNGAGFREPVLPRVQGTDFGAQQPDWQKCYESFECARVNAPLDWAEQSGDTIELSLIKRPATGGAPVGSIFVNPGGPGAPGVEYVAGSYDRLIGRSLQEKYDVIGWDPRGVGLSSSVHCYDDADMDEELFGKSATDGLTKGSQAWVDAALKESTAFGEACAKNTGPLLGHVDTASTVKDLDMMREIVGDKQLNYLGFSYGTYIGARYADAYPNRVGRMVLDGVMDPTTRESEVVREQTRGFELALRAYVSDCLKKAQCPVSGTVDEAMAKWRALIDQVEASPIEGKDGRLVGSGVLLTAIITPLYSQQNWPYLDRLYTSVQSGEADVALALADSYYDRVDGTYASNLITAFQAINCLDYPRSSHLDLDQMRAEAQELEEIAPTIGAYQGYGDVGCAQWPEKSAEDRSPVTAAGSAPILLVGTTGDPATPYRWAESLAAQLQSSTLLTYDGEGHVAYGKSTCVNQIVDEYFMTGNLPEAGKHCAA